MRRLVSTFAVVGLALGLGLGAMACKDKGPMEKAGESVDKAVDDIKDAGQGTMERAGEKVDEGLDKAKDAVD
jgi:hypothetical protein